jgi:phospholipid-translocating ATPase
MYHEESDEPCLPRSWNIADDLGQIDYILSDKTGTLTRNIMQFKKCSINGKKYGDDLKPVNSNTSATNKPTIKIRPTLAEIAKRNFNPITPSSAISVKELHIITTPKTNLKRLGFFSRLFNINRYDKAKTMPSDSFEFSKEESSKNSDLKFEEQTLKKELSNSKSPQYAAVRDFFTLIAVCHSVLVDQDSHNPTDEIKYMAQSPDESALLHAAKDLGFIFVGRGQNTITVDVLGEKETCIMLNVIEFNSSRKRMSVIVRRPGGEIVLYCKGADSVIYERLAQGQDKIKLATASHIEDFATEGKWNVSYSKFVN